MSDKEELKPKQLCKFAEGRNQQYEYYQYSQPQVSSSIAYDISSNIKNDEKLDEVIAEDTNELILPVFGVNKTIEEKWSEAVPLISNSPHLSENDNDDEKYYRPNIFQKCIKFYNKLYAEVEKEKAVEIDFNEEAIINIESYKVKFSFSRLWKFTGTSLLMSIAYLDIGNIESDLQSGAYYGYQLIWVLFYSTILGWLLQLLAIRLGCVTGYNLAEMCRSEYNGYLSTMIWICIEFAIITADIQAVLGCAIAFEILLNIKLWAGCILTAAISFFLLFLNIFGLKVMEIFFAIAIAFMACCFAAECIISQPSIVSILEGWVFPLCDTNAEYYAIATVGAVIMPHNLFLHSALVQSRRLRRSSRAALMEGNFYFGVESAIILFLSFLVNLCIIAVFASFYVNGESSSIGLANASDYLGVEFGSATKYIFAIGILCSGQLSTITSTYTGQLVINGFFNLSWTKLYQRNIFTRLFTLTPALVVAILFSDSFDTLNENINVLQSILIPFALLPLLFFNCNPRIMGETFAFSVRMQVFYAFLALVIIVINISLIVVSFVKWDTGENSDGRYVLMAVILIVYMALILWIVVDYFWYKAKEKNDAFVE